MSTSIETQITMIPNGKGGMYYDYEGIFYDYHVPVAWVLQSTRLSEGPKFCEDCRANGFRNGVFVCFCCQCAYVFNGTKTLNATALRHNEMTQKLPYMNGTTLDNIGIQQTEEERKQAEE